MQLFKVLNEPEKESFRKWARENYKPFDAINGLWHPIIQLECVLINTEEGSK